MFQKTYYSASICVFFKRGVANILERPSALKSKKNIQTISATLLEMLFDKKLPCALCTECIQSVQYGESR